MSSATMLTATSLAASVAESMSVGELLQQGGLAMLPIYACSVAALGLFVHKVLELRAAKTTEVAWVRAVLGHVADGELEDAQHVCRTASHPAARVVAALTGAMRERPGHAEAEAKRVASLELQRLERHVGTLSFIAQVSPLLGLLGTVIGMVDLFMGLQGADQATLAVADLASGIWTALLTTAAGLAVAVPALAAHAYLEGRIDGIRLQIVDIVQRVVFAAAPGES